MAPALALALALTSTLASTLARAGYISEADLRRVLRSYGRAGSSGDELHSMLEGALLLTLTLTLTLNPTPTPTQVEASRLRPQARVL